MVLTRHLFTFCGALAALSLLGIAALILAQIGLRLMGSQIPSADDFAAWGLSASIFLALPAALVHGDHIRVTSLRQLLPEGLGRMADILAAGFATAMMGWVAWAIFGYVEESWRYDDVSQGIVAVPLWIPQSAMLLGSILFALAFAERTLRLLLGLPVERDDTDEQGHGE
ncbi:TRAP transporter small permease [Mameliella sediminis]|uniref:TRAP transporter small permease n=1 Tax=Mameliella sediminis TaxID=2836866 RepID=UPI001C483477|nr:TRAP transporter small permease [Mameliella sediminis]MBY6144772.1 TRAP transporter small permease [Mameliella alba]MBV7395886.1 TRAP transporter small permease [Mameliella sediminis]MBY6160299.1 TRAP transporter small permease [Mameliella alba]MBY6168769.1 TRAP transporter small permease [Mameliella alba]MBY6174010.1 TRAP transporter small permease [Mameliella alba]